MSRDVHGSRRRREIAKRRLAAGIEAEQIEADFVSWGVDADDAKRVVAEAVEYRGKDVLRERVQPVWIGGSMLVVGVLLTVIGMQRSMNLGDGRVHQYLLMGVLILPAAAAYACFGLLQLATHHAEQKRERGMERMERQAAETRPPKVNVPERLAA